jgi:hypothetical protein
MRGGQGREANGEVEVSTVEERRRTEVEEAEGAEGTEKKSNTEARRHGV